MRYVFNAKEDYLPKLWHYPLELFSYAHGRGALKLNLDTNV